MRTNYLSAVKKGLRSWRKMKLLAKNPFLPTVQETFPVICVNNYIGNISLITSKMHRLLQTS